MKYVKVRDTVRTSSRHPLSGHHEGSKCNQFSQPLKPSVVHHSNLTLSSAHRVNIVISVTSLDIQSNRSPANDRLLNSYYTCTSRVPVDGKLTSMCVVFEIHDNNINYYHYQPGSNIITVEPIFQTHHTHCSNHYAHYKCIGYVIIPKPISSSHKGINCRCRRFDLLPFAVLAQYFAAMTAVLIVQVVGVR